jgi:monomeric isocitrate dehydrogenase
MKCSCYAGVYKQVIEDCRQNGQFNQATMGSCVAFFISLFLAT